MSLVKLSSKLAWTAAFLLTAINTYSFADRQLPSIMIPELKAELLLTDAQIGFLFGTVFAIFFGISTLIFGRLADTPYRKNVLIFAIIMWSVLTGLCGIAQQFWDLIIFRIGVGVGEAALGPIALVVLSAYFTREKLPLALGIWGAGPFLGSALAGWGGAAVITNMDKIKPYLGFLSEFSDWRITFFLFAVPGLIFALLLKFLPLP
ncbi:MAG: MFS transporter [Pseudomonadota bacterium]|nr:MFS transporter [Pseudomonadota bacterium]